MNDFSKRIGGIYRQSEFFSADSQRTPADFEAYLCRRLRGETDASAGWLNSLSFHGAVKACEMIGAVAVNGPFINAFLISDDGWRDASTAGFSILSGGPSGFRDLVDDLFRRPNISKKPSLGTYLGQIYRWLHDAEADEYEPFREIVRDLALGKLSFTPEDRIFGKLVGDRRRLHSVHSAAREFGVDARRLRRRLIAGGFLDASDAHLTDDMTLFPADTRAHEFLTNLQDSISLKAAEKYLNAPRVQVTLLYHTGVIVPWGDSSPISGDGETHLTFTRSDLDSFLRRLTADATEAQPDDHGLEDIPKAAKRARCHSMEIVNMLLDHGLRRVRLRSTLTGFMSVLVDPVEVRANLRSGDRPGLSIHEVCLRTKWGRPVIDALIRGGHLKARTIRNPVTRWHQMIVESQDIERFEASYVSLQSIAKERRTTFLKARIELEKTGVGLAFDKEEVHRSFYRRSDLLP